MRGKVLGRRKPTIHGLDNLFQWMQHRMINEKNDIFFDEIEYLNTHFEMSGRKSDILVEKNTCPIHADQVMSKIYKIKKVDEFKICLVQYRYCPLCNQTYSSPNINRTNKEAEKKAVKFQGA